MVSNIVQTQLAITEIDQVQKHFAQRIEQMFMKTKYRSRFTAEQRSIRKKIKKPLHKGTIAKLKTLEVDKMTDDQLMQRLDDIFAYIDLSLDEEQKDLRNTEIELICFEIFI